MNRRHPLKVSDNRDLSDITDYTKVNKELVQSLPKNTKLATEMHRKYFETRFEKKSAKLFDNIPKTKKTSKVRDDTHKYELNKETKFVKEKSIMQSHWTHLLKKSLMENFIFCAVYLR